METCGHWQISPKLDFLNHGSFGATPIAVSRRQREWNAELECDPIEFLGPERSLLPKLDRVRAKVAELIGADTESLAFVRNATDGVNAVLRSFSFRAGDEVVITSHGYNACNNAARFVCERAGAQVCVAEIPFVGITDDAVVECIESTFTSKTRLLVIDHVTSPTATILPIARVVLSARERGVRVLVDGAHGPGMVDINLQELQPDYYTGNHHKWWCAPKASGFLYVDSKFREEVRPTIISHGMNTIPEGRSLFHAEFDWVGTYDPSSVLALPTALDFLASLWPGGLEELMRRNRDNALAARSILCEALSIAKPSPDTMIGSMAAVPIACQDSKRLEQLKAFLRDEHHIEVPVFEWQGLHLLRVSLQAYNSLVQIERLAKRVKDYLDRS